MPVAQAERKTARGQAIRIEGGLLGPDFLELLKVGDIPGQKPRDFGVEDRPLLEEIAAVYREAKYFWEAFRSGMERLPEGDSGTTLTRERWMIPFLSLLGYELFYNRRGYDVDGQIFAISHRAGEDDDAPPVHIVGAQQKLGERPPSGRPRLSPHALVQEYLNRTEHLWGLVTNGQVLRLLRKTPMVRHQAYVEFDLAAIFEEERFRDFEALYRLLHRTRLPRGLADAPECWLERYYLEAVEQGTRARERISKSVEQGLLILANGLLKHPRNERLRQRAEKDGSQFARSFYRDLLRLVYRFLFLLVAEERELLGGSDLYREHYSIARLRRLADNHRAYTDHEDLWHSLGILWYLLRDAAPIVDGKPLASLLELPVLDGDLFQELELENCHLANRDLLKAIWHLSYYQDERGTIRRVNYAYLDVEELGSVYESLLDYRPVIVAESGHPVFKLAEGTERKSTGSYYTPRELVAELVKSALEPVLEERLAAAKTTEEKERAILSIKVCDPATGSGHFLLAAARRLGKELARVRTGEEEPSPEAQREAIRDVITHCIYGVDVNPLAVELCKVALWIEGHTPGKPLTFLDHRIKCGNSLIGVFDLSVLEEGIPDDAYKPVTGDDKEVAKALKKQNRKERKAWEAGQYHLFEEDLRELAEKLSPLEELGDSTPEEIQRKKGLFLEFQRDPCLVRDRLACDLWTAAFFAGLTSGSAGKVPTSEALRRGLEEKPIDTRVAAYAQALAEKHKFFHWPLEFPEVFAQGGFDVVLSNPPWDQLQFDPREFFAVRNPVIAEAPNMAERERMIRELSETAATLFVEYQQARHQNDCEKKFIHESGRYPLTSFGRINLAPLFTELSRALLASHGRAGLIVPTGIATDSFTQAFFRSLIETGQLASLFDFENREGIFPAVHRSYKFSLFTIWGREANGELRTVNGRERGGRKKFAIRRLPLATFAFFCTRTEHLRDPRRVFTLSPEDIARINPNTRTCPIFRTRQDAELTKAIYERVPVLVNEATGENPWAIQFKLMFMMNTDSHLFRTRKELEEAGYELVGNRFVKEGEIYLPLYEAKMIHQFDHRFGTYEGLDSRPQNAPIPTPFPEDHTDPAFVIQPWYWVPQSDVKSRLKEWSRNWLLGFRDVARSTDERTAIFSLLPRVGVGNNTPLVLFETDQTTLAGGLLANLDSLVFDYVTRQKIAGTHMNFFFVQQLPALPPSAYTKEDLLFIVPRVLELIYTAWDIKPFADDVWRESVDTLREAIHRQWEDNAEETGGHRWELPDWIEAYPEIESDPDKGIPLPPFKWDESRRARLRAELDAYYARIYGLTRKQLRYILDPTDLTERELEDILDPWEVVRDPLDPEGYAERVRKSTFPGETFRVLKEKELRLYGEYRTRRLVLEAWEQLEME